jgi:hypothetical protein
MKCFCEKANKTLSYIECGEFDYLNVLLDSQGDSAPRVLFTLSFIRAASFLSNMINALVHSCPDMLCPDSRLKREFTLILSCRH